MQELSVLSDKLDVLLKKFTLMQAENNRLRVTIADNKKEIETLNGKLTLLEENMMAAQMGSNSMLNDNDKDVVKKQLDTVLGEIDKILATLND